jgi:hypothetical protein
MRAGSQYPGSVNACSRPCFRRGYTHSGFCAPTKRVDFWCSAAVTAAVVSPDARARSGFGSLQHAAGPEGSWNADAGADLRRSYASGLDGVATTMHQVAIRPTVCGRSPRRAVPGWCR